MITFIRTNSQDPVFIKLAVLLDSHLKERDGDEHAFYSQFNKMENISTVVLCYENNIPIGCGAFKKYSSHEAEIKRIFVTPSSRGKGIAFNILGHLEKWVLEVGYTECVLETGKNQPEAIKLYTKAGYHVIESYGQYKNVDNSICMRKVLS